MLISQNGIGIGTIQTKANSTVWKEVFAEGYMTCPVMDSSISLSEPNAASQRSAMQTEPQNIPPTAGSQK